MQNLYVKEIKAYKAPPVVCSLSFFRPSLVTDRHDDQAQDAHVGVVRSYSQPPKPQAPALPTDLASELAAYDAAEPTQADAVAPTSTEDGGAGAEAYLAFLEEDLPKKVDHHH